jgi:quercetin dioxygenase-like cupin family protein
MDRPMRMNRPARSPHPLAGPALTFDLAAEAAALMLEPTWLTTGHNAKTLTKYPDMRTVLIALRGGARMPEHRTDQCVTIQVLAGRLRVHLPTTTVDLAAGALLALEHTASHDVEARGDSVFLMSLGWSRPPAGTD